MPLQLAAPIEKEFPLEETDRQYGSEGTRVTIRQATQAQHERRAALFSTLVREYANENPDGDVRVIQKFSYPELMRIEAWLTLSACNIADEKGRELFRPKMNETQFAEAWGKLPPLIAREIHDKVIEVNVDWNPEGE